MNPNGLSQELRKLPGNIRSPHFPGGTLISAVLDRRLMGWSDRGGASRIFGDIWSEFCWRYLSDSSPVFTDAPTAPVARTVIRLDDNPGIAIQAGRNKLANPDFLVLDQSASGSLNARAVDAKFAVDRIRRTQVSAKSVYELISLPGSLTRKALIDRFGDDAPDRLSFETGAFLGPNSLLNNYFRQKLTTGPEPEIPESELKLITVDPEQLFESVAEFSIMKLMKSVDRLSGTDPETDLVLGMYYLRLACAARWIETQTRLPLLSDQEPEEVDVTEILDATRRRMEPGVSAYGIVEEWSRSAEIAAERQKMIQDAARMPVKMAEIRMMVARVGLEDDRKVVRQVRGSLEQTFVKRLIENVGTIPAEPNEPIPAVLDRIATSSQQLRSEMLVQANRVTEEFAETAAIHSKSA